MDGTAVNAIRDLAQQAAGKDVLVWNGAGEEFSSVALHRLPREEKPDQPATLIINSLQGLVDYIQANRDRLSGEECFVHVLSPTSVRVVSGLQERAARFTYIEAKANDLFAELVEHPMPLLDANIALQARVADGFDRDKVLKLLGNIRDQAELKVDDDGVTQAIGTRAGIALSDESKVPNPVTLAPYRTFREIDQPESPFIFRLHRSGSLDKAPTASFHDADGGKWELRAVEEIASWLTGKVGDFAVIR